jgi:hypothetical protein
MRLARFYLGVAACLLAACTREQAKTPVGVSAVDGPIARTAGGEEEIIGLGVMHASGSTVYHAYTPGGFLIYWHGLETHKWGVYDSVAGFPDTEQHDDYTFTHPSGREQHIVRNGAHEVGVVRTGRSWNRFVALLGAGGGYEDNTAWSDVSVQVDENTPTTSLAGSLRRSTSYAQAPDTAAFGTGNATVVTGTPLWFISTYRANAGGSNVYAPNLILNSFNFDYGGAASNWQAAVNSSDPCCTLNSLIPFRHVFRSPGRTRRYVVRVRVVEPYHNEMENGRIAADADTITVTADSACWHSTGSFTNTPVHFDASCSDTRNAGVARYQWVFTSTDSSSWSTSNSIDHTFTTPGYYNVKLRIRLTTGEGGADSTIGAISIARLLDSVRVVVNTDQGSRNPAVVRPNELCEFDVTPYGGLSPFTYTWQQQLGARWVTIGTEDVLYYMVRGTGTTLRGTAIDAIGQTANRTIVVTPSSSGATCIM